MSQFEESLQNAILTWCAMDGDVGIIELHKASVLHKRKIVAVDGRRGAVGQFHMPVGTSHNDDIDIVTILVEEGIKPLCRTQRHFIL